MIKEDDLKGKSLAEKEELVLNALNLNSIEKEEDNESQEKEKKGGRKVKRPTKMWFKGD